MVLLMYKHHLAERALVHACRPLLSAWMTPGHNTRCDFTLLLLFYITDRTMLKRRKLKSTMYKSKCNMFGSDTATLTISKATLERVWTEACCSCRHAWRQVTTLQSRPFLQSCVLCHSISGTSGQQCIILQSCLKILIFVEHLGCRVAWHFRSPPITPVT